MTNMYKKISLALLVATGLFATTANAQLATGSITVGTTPGYATIANAIDSLNLYGVTVPTTINIPSGYTETAPAGGFNITATGTLANPIVITGVTGGAKPVLTASATNLAGTLTDAIIKIVGGDFITINGLELRENAANTVAAAATNTMTEWGIALLYASTTNASQNITLTNNTIVLSSATNYQNAFGIYANATHSATAIATSVSATTALGTNSGLVVKSNTISGVNNGIVVIGALAAADQNDGITIGGATPAEGNTITGYGFTSTFSSYVNISGSVNGVLVRNSKNVTVSNNTLTSSALTTVGTVFGIQFPAFSATPTGAFIQNINGNSISLKTNLISGGLTGISMPSGSASTTSTININNNNFSNFDHATATATGVVTFITQTGAHQFINVNNNTFTNISLKTTGNVTFINNNLSSPANGIKNVNGNSIVTAFNKTGAGGTVTCFTDNGSSPATATNNTNNNNFSNITVTGATTIMGLSNTDGGTPIKSVNNNILSNWVGGTSAVTGLNIGFSSNCTVNGNLVSNITSAGAITGITTGSSTSEIASGNTVHSLTSTGASLVMGIANTGGTTKVFNGNKIYNLEANNAGGSVNGILLSSGTTVTVQNNVIGDLRAPIATGATEAVRGINITSTSTVSNYNIYYNSIYLNAVSTGTNFSTTGILHTTSATATTAQLNLNNNVIVNKSTPMGTGVTSALRRSSTTLTNFGTTSNNNILYVDTTLANRAMLFDGTTQTQGLLAYKTLVTPRDASSKWENVAFVSTVGANPTFLQINSVTPTFAESGAVNIGGITTDFGGITRQGNAGYVGTGTAPDMGAYEFNGVTNLPLCAGTPAASNAVATSTLVCAGSTFGLSLSTNYSGTSGITYQWQSSPDSITFTNIASATGPTYTASQTATTFYHCIITCTNSTMSDTSAAIKVSVNSFLNCYCAATYSSGCGSGDEITKVVYKSINNVSTCSAGNYANYNTPNPTVFLGATDTMRVSFGTDGSQYSAVWIDFNQDGDFADAGEYVVNSTATAGASGTTTYLITIPATATVGTTKMRIRGGNDSPLTNTPCGVSSSGFGETEDYLITLACPTMAGPSTTNAFICTGNTATLTATANNAGTLKWYTDTVGGTLIKTGTSYTTSTLSADTTLWVQETIGASCISPRIKVKVNITQVTVALNPVNVQCKGGNNGSFTLGTITCGTAPFTYSVNGGAFGSIPTNLVAGTYTVVAKDAALLSSGPITVVVTEPIWTVNNPTAANLVVCEGTTTANLTGSANLSTIATGSQVITFGLAAQPLEVGASSSSPVITTTPNIIATATMNALPAGAVITNVKLSMPNLTALGSSWAADVFLGVTGAINTSYAKDSLAPSSTASNPLNFNYAKYFTPTSSTVTGGAVNLHYFESYPNDNAGVDCTFPTGAAVATLTVNYTYNIPANVTWWDSLSGGALLVANDTLNAIGTTVLPNTLTPGVYNFYAQADNAGCFAPARTLTTVTVNAKATTPVITAGGATTFCAGDSVQLTSSAATLNTWNNAATTAVIKVKTSNTYYTIANNVNGCKSDTSNKITVVVNALPATPIVTTTANVITCNTPSVTLKATNYPTGLVWSNAATTDSLVLTSTGTFSATHTDVNGCKSLVSNVVTITDSLNSNFTLNAATPNDSICLGGSVTLSVTGLAGGLTYTWTPSTTLSASAGTSVIATPTAQTTYSVMSDNGVGCMTTKTITITPVTPPTVTIMGDTAVCAGLSTTLMGMGADNYAWTSGPATATNVVTPTAMTTYEVIGTNTFGCADTATFMVNVNALPAAPIISASASQITCVVTSSTLASNYTSGLTWSNGDTTATSTTTVAGTFTAIETDANGCVSPVSNAIVITNNTGITLAFTSPTPNDSICVGGTANLSVTGTGVNYTWSPALTLNTTTGTSVIATPTATTTYTVIADNGVGCTVKDSVTITIVPNAIVTATAASPVVTVTSGNISNPITVTGATTFDFTSTVTGVATHTMTVGNALTTSINDSIGATTGGNGTVDYVITGYNAIGCPSAPVMVTVNISSVVALANQAIDANLNIYPNPTANVLNVSVKANTLNVTMFDMNGKVVKQANVNGNNTQLTVSDLASGTYSLRITTEAGTTVKKVTVTKE